MNIYSSWPSMTPIWEQNVSGHSDESGIRLGASFEGAKAADWAALKSTSLMAL